LFMEQTLYVYLLSRIMHDDLELEKLIVFAIANYHLALPIDQVLRVVNYPTETSKPLEKVGLIQLGRHAIRVVNLSQRLELSQGTHSTQFPFLMLIRGLNQELCGIPIPTPPDLIEISTEELQPLEWSPAASPLLATVSHAAVVNQENATLSILLLDLSRVLVAPEQKLLGTSLAQL